MPRRPALTPEPDLAARSAARVILFRLLPILAAGYALLLVDRAAVGFAAAQLQPALNLDARQLGFIAPILLLGVLLFEVPGAMMADRIGPRPWLVGSLLIWGLASIGTAAAGTPGAFYWSRCIASAAQAGFVPAAAMLLASWAPTFCRTRMLAWLIMAGLASAALAPLLVPPLLGSDSPGRLAGWRWLFLAIGAPCVVLAGVLGSRLGDMRRVLTATQRDTLVWLRATEADGRPLPPRLSALLDVRLFLLAGINFGLSLSAVAGSIWYSNLMQDARVPMTAVTIGVLALSGVIVWLWCRRVDRSDRLADGLVMACALTAVSYAGGVAGGSRLTMLVGLAAHAATLAAARVMLLSVASRLLALRGGGAVALAVIDATGLVAAFIAPRVVRALAEQAQSLHAGLLGIVLLLVVTAGLAGSLRLVEQRA